MRLARESLSHEVMQGKRPMCSISLDGDLCPCAFASGFSALQRWATRTVVFVLTALFVFVGCSKKKQVHANPFGDASGYVVFQDGSKYGYRDATGTIVIKPQFAEAGNFSWGLARVKPETQGGWEYIDASGDVVLKPRYEAAGDFVDGIAVVLNKGEFTYIGPDGESMGLFEEDVPTKLPAVGDTFYVIHPKGLIERSSGDLSSAPITQIPPGGTVILASDRQPQHTEIDDGLRGRWVAVRSKGTPGYVFDLYCSRFPLELDHSPTEHYRVVGSSLNNDQYSVYTLTEFATGGRLIVHNGPNWSETREFVPDATVDQVVARLKLYPSGELGTLLQSFHGQPGKQVTERGDTVAVNVSRNNTGFLQMIALSRHNEETMFDATISTNTPGSVQITTTSSVPPADTDNELK